MQGKIKRYFSSKYILIFFMTAALLFQTGCWDQKIFEQIGFILQIGFELDEKGELLYTAKIPVFTEDIEQRAELISTNTDIVREGRDKAKLKAAKLLECGKVQHLFFSEELAKKGIDRFFDVYIRLSENPLLANLIVVEGSPKEMMERSNQFEEKPRPVFYVNSLLTDAREHSYTPETRIYEFITLYYSETADPIMPTVKYNDKEIEISGTAVFDGEKMVGKINAFETPLLLTMIGSNKKVGYFYKAKEDEDAPVKGASLIFDKANRKIKTKVESAKPSVNIDLYFKGLLSEYEGANKLDDSEFKKKLEKTIQDSIKNDCEKLLSYLKEVNSDPIGFEEMFRAKHNDFWKNNDWKKVYKELEININVKVAIDLYGSIY